MDKYNPNEIEPKWRKFWDEKGLHKADDFSDKPKYYCLIEFPYPSGDGLHVGHIRSNTAMDIIARKRRMEGFNVLYPIGWDAFGLPTENYAIKTGKHPSLVTKENTDKFRRQLKAVGFSFDWDREINTTDPEYYKWTQWIFLQLYKKGLAYKKKMPINWCLSCKTGLANEEVVDGKCERCGGEVEKREKEQWMLAITKYADRLAEDLDEVDYLEKIKIQQRNWIGKSEGTEIEFKVKSEKPGKEDVLILHGWEDSSKSGFIPELEKFLREKGHNVVALDLPNTDTPNFNEWFDFAEKNIKENNLKNFSIVGHSMGGHLALKLAEKYKLKKLVLVAPVGFEKKTSDYFLQFKDELSADGLNIFKNYQDRDLDAESVIKNVDSINFIFGENDPWITSEIRNFYSGKFKNIAEMRIVPEKGHLSEDEGVKKVPEVENVFDDKKIEVFTTRVDTLFGATYCVLAPENPLIDELKAQIENWDEVEKYRRETARKAEMERTAEGKEKTGVELKGVKAVNPVNGGEIPIFAADYVLGHYGTGAVMAVPAHDERDFEFAKKYGLPIKRVIVPVQAAGGEESASAPRASIGKLIKEPTASPRVAEPDSSLPFAEDGVLADSGKFSGMPSKEAREKITKWLEEKGLGGKKTTYKLRDWVFSRQRYWGEPIPIIFCGKCGIVPVPEKELPVKLPEVEKYEPTDTGESPLARMPEWVNVKCPECGGNAKRETDTMPNWAGSSWYFLRYTDPKNKDAPADKKKLEYWMPVDWYNGGMEHTTLHLLYSRFWNKFLYDIGAVPVSEPYKKRTAHGMILGEGGEKMSKSKGNVINPDDIVKEHGADTLRLYEMFMGPFDQAIPWNTDSMVGLKRFLEKVWRLQYRTENRLGTESASEPEEQSSKLEALVHKTIKKAAEDIEDFKFNTALSQMMILVNEMEKEKELRVTDYGLLVTLLSPFAPHIAEELWSRMGNEKSIFEENWPEYDPEKIKEKKIKLVVQVDGRVRDIVEAEAGISEDEAKVLTLERENVKKHLEDKSIKKIIFVSDKLINIVTK